MLALYKTKIFAEMTEEGAKLERDNTMVATAKVSDTKGGCEDFFGTLFYSFPVCCTFQEGEAYLETKGGVNEDAKTRAQQKELDEITAKEQSELKRTTTMAETAKVSKYSR